MRVVTIAARKGGAGKSTIAAHLSALADRPDLPALLIDSDPQGSLAFWHSLREAATPVLVRCQAVEIADTLAAARRDGLEWAFIDTPPHNEPDIGVAMRLADLVLIPTRPAAFDIAGVAATIELARQLGRPFLVVLNSVPPRRGIEAGVTTEAREALRRLGAPVWGGSLVGRIALAHALASGSAVHEFEPAGPAALEVEALWRDLRRIMGGERVEEAA